jgi:hypothetical protein
MTDNRADLDPSTWDHALDAVIAAPKYHKVLFENVRMHVLEVTLEANDEEPVHHHRSPSVPYGCRSSTVSRCATLPERGMVITRAPDNKFKLNFNYPPLMSDFLKPHFSAGDLAEQTKGPRPRRIDAIGHESARGVPEKNGGCVRRGGEGESYGR